MKFKTCLFIGIGSFIFVCMLILFFLLLPSGKISEFASFQPDETIQNRENQHQQLPLKVSYFGVSTLLFDDGKDQILIDGFLSRPSLTQVIFNKINSDPSLIHQYIQQYDLKRTQAIFVTHSHYDHALDVPHLAQSLSHAKIVGSKSTLNIARGGDIPETQLIQVRPFHSMTFGQFEVIAIPSKHTPPTAVNDDLGEEIKKPLILPARFSAFKEGGSFDYLINYQGYKILVKASTGAVAEQFKNLKIDALFLGIAQLSKQSAEFQTRYLHETLGTLKPTVVIPIHWDNFFSPAHQPLEFLPRIADNAPQSMHALVKEAKKQNSRVVLLTTPKAYAIFNPSHTDKFS